MHTLKPTVLKLIHTLAISSAFFLASFFHDFITLQKNIATESFILSLETDISSQGKELNQLLEQFVKDVKCLPQEERHTIRNITFKYRISEILIMVIFSYFLVCSMQDFEKKFNAIIKNSGNV